MSHKVSEAELEALRRKAKWRLLLVLVFSGVLCVLYLSFFIWCGYRSDELSVIEKIIMAVFFTGILGFGSLGLLWFLFVKRSYSRFNDTFKKQYVLETIEGMGLFRDLQYDLCGGFSHDAIRNAAVVACGEKRYFLSEDLLSGSYQGRRFWAGDVTTRVLVHRQKRAVIETIFEGQVIRFAGFDDGKTSSGHLQIFQKEFLSNIKGWTAEYKIETENEAFNSRFQIYAADEHNAYYILTPQLMEKIMAFAGAVGEQVAITFCGPDLYIAIKRVQSMFDANVEQPVAVQRENILEDARLLQKAGELILCKAAH